MADKAGRMVGLKLLLVALILTLSAPHDFRIGPRHDRSPDGIAELLEAHVDVMVMQGER